jgi:sodium-dependent phosphate cotransporter
MEPAVSSPTEPRLPALARALLVVGLLYLFLAGVKLLESGIKGIGTDFTDALFENVTNPLAGLFVGVLATVLVQSSSVTTATIVGLVAAGVVSVESAVPMIMGANIGTTVTNTLVSLGNVHDSAGFRRAFAAATMHDFFNLIAVAVLLPLELLTGFLSSSASAIAELISGQTELGGSFDSPIKAAVSWMAGVVEAPAEALLGDGRALGVGLIVMGIAFIFATLTLITKNMRILVADRIEHTLNAVLAKSGMAGLFVGVVVTIAVQSSSITTSILVPLVASGVLLVRNAYPITLGANVGTTITALLAALGAGAVDGLTIALTHTLFNIAGILLVYPWPATRHIPVQLAEWLSEIATRRRTLALAYVAAAFIVIPLVGVVVL